MSRFVRLSTAAASLAALLAGCIERSSVPSGPRVDSESHWLSPCEADAQCGALQCICGVCSRDCGALACGGEATCAPFGADTCGAVPACTTACVDDGDCPGTLRCLDGVCDAPPACADDGDCAVGVCRSDRCVPAEICGDGLDEDGDGGDCDDPDCLADPACADAAARFEAPPRVVACSDSVELAEGLAGTAALDGARVADLRFTADTLATLATDAEPPLAAALGRLADALGAAAGGLEAGPVDACAAPGCDGAAVMRAELSLIDGVMAAVDALEPAAPVFLPYTDCALATLRVRAWRRSLYLAERCPGHDRATYEAPLVRWRQWAHDAGLRLEARCAWRAGWDLCAPGDAVGDEPGCQ